jgi:hypothetical protein
LTTPNLAALPWRRVERPLFPLDDTFVPHFTLFPGR